MTHKTIKTVDEKVAEALGWNIVQCQFSGLMYFNEGVQMLSTYKIEGFFTRSIANCKKYVEPELLKQAIFRFTKQVVPVNIWSVEGWDNPLNVIFYATGETEEMAYCNALLDLKEREK